MVVAQYKKYFYSVIRANAIMLDPQSPEINYWLAFNPRIEINFDANSDVQFIELKTL